MLCKVLHHFKIPLKQKTHTEKKTLAEEEIIIRKFYKHLLRVRKKGKYELADIANLE